MHHMSVRVRMAPSPTGYLHIGNLRTALYNEFFARHHCGTLILRIEDTDRARYIEGATESLCRSLRAMHILPDEGVWINEAGQLIERGDYAPYLQSKRAERHREYAQKLIAMGKAYVCFCSPAVLDKMRQEQQKAGMAPRYDGRCRLLHPEESAARVSAGESHVIRLAFPREGSVTVMDEIRGDVVFDWNELDDQVIIKSDGMPTYHLAATCDDHDMWITHVIRGEEWLPSTPKHLFIYEAFGWKPPIFAHLPLLLNPDKTKLSKRQGDVSVEDFLAKGYLPEALLNFVALLGWNPSGDREIYTHDELRSAFELEKVNKSGAVLNLEKLDWMNAEYLKSMDTDAYLDLVLPELRKLGGDEALQKRVAMLIRSRLIRLSDVPDVSGEYFHPLRNLNPSIIPWKGQQPADVKEKLAAAREELAGLPDYLWASTDDLEHHIKEWITRRAWQNGPVLWPLRVALSGREKSPSPFELLHVLGREASLARIQAAIDSLQ